MVILVLKLSHLPPQYRVYCKSQVAFYADYIEATNKDICLDKWMKYCRGVVKSIDISAVPCTLSVDEI